MEDWKQHSLEEKVDLENLLLIPSDSYSNESLKELKIDNIDVIDNSAKTEIKTEEIELNDGEGNAETFEYFTNGNEEVCQICGLKFGNNLYFICCFRTFKVASKSQIKPEYLVKQCNLKLSSHTDLILNTIGAF